MRKPKYVFNPHSLHFEKVRVRFGALLLRALGFVATAIVFGAVILFFSYQYLDSPKEKFLKDQLANNEMQMELMQAKMNELGASLAELQERDERLYRTIFEAAPISEQQKQAGTGGTNRYENLDDMMNGDHIKQLQQRLDQLNATARIQSQSFQELEQLARRKAEMLACIPAIQPISNKKLKHLSSGFGYRIDPIYKTSKLHPGMDFTAPVGTPIYATGDGTIESAEFELGGYGNAVVINHGFGYKTLYGHMSRFNVKRGQKVKRGDVIGYVGSTGKSTGPHVHYEVIKNGNKINPINFYFNDLSNEEYNQVLKIASQNSQTLD